MGTKTTCNAGGAPTHPDGFYRPPDDPDYAVYMEARVALRAVLVAHQNREIKLPLELHGLVANALKK